MKINFSKWTLTAALAALCLNSPTVVRAADNAQEERDLIVALQAANTSAEDRVKACKRLALIGSPAAVPVLAGLLADEKMSHMARYALEPMPGGAADEALVSALDKTKGNFRVGVINSIGVRQYAPAVPKLAALLSDPDHETAAAAANSLGWIATAPAIQALEGALAGAKADRLNAFADAGLTCADALLSRQKNTEAAAMFDRVGKLSVPRHIKMAAMRGAIVARGAAGLPLLIEQLRSQDDGMIAVGLKVARELPGAEVTKALVAEAAKLTGDKQVLVIQALGDRADPAALPALMAAAKSGDPKARMAAIRGFGRVADGTVVPILLEAAAGDDADLAKTAQSALYGLPGDSMDQALLKAVNEGAPNLRKLAIETVEERRVAGATPVLMRASGDANGTVRSAAIKALGVTINQSEFAGVAGMLIAAKTDAEVAAAETALSAAGSRLEDKAACADSLLAILPRSKGEAKLSVLRLLGELGGAKALAAVRAASKDSDAAVREAAMQSLCDWATPDALADLQALAKGAGGDKYKLLALRGSIRLIEPLEASADRKLTLLKDAMQMAPSNNEKKLALSVCGSILSPEALAYAASFVNDAALKEEAAVAAVSIGEKLAKSHKAPVIAAMNQVLKAKPNNWTARRARGVLAEAGG